MNGTAIYDVSVRTFNLVVKNVRRIPQYHHVITNNDREDLEEKKNGRVHL